MRFVRSKAYTFKGQVLSLTVCFPSCCIISSFLVELITQLTANTTNYKLSILLHHMFLAYRTKANTGLNNS